MLLCFLDFWTFLRSKKLTLFRGIRGHCLSSVGYGVLKFLIRYRMHFVPFLNHRGRQRFHDFQSLVELFVRHCEQKKIIFSFHRLWSLERTEFQTGKIDSTRRNNKKCENILKWGNFHSFINVLLFFLNNFDKFFRK